MIGQIAVAKNLLPCDAELILFGLPTFGLAGWRCGVGWACGLGVSVRLGGAGLGGWGDELGAAVGAGALGGSSGSARITDHAAASLFDTEALVFSVWGGAVGREVWVCFSRAAQLLSDDKKSVKTTRLSCTFKGRNKRILRSIPKDFSRNDDY